MVLALAFLLAPFVVAFTVAAAIFVVRMFQFCKDRRQAGRARDQHEAGLHPAQMSPRLSPEPDFTARNIREYAGSLPAVYSTKPVFKPDPRLLPLSGATGRPLHYEQDGNVVSYLAIQPAGELVIALDYEFYRAKIMK